MTLRELYQNQNGSKKEYTKQDFEIDLVQLGYPEDAIKILELAEQGKFCGNCAAYDISPKMVACGGADAEGTFGYCKMHDFSCHKNKTCLTYAPGGPKK